MKALFFAICFQLIGVPILFCDPKVDEPFDYLEFKKRIDDLDARLGILIEQESKRHPSKESKHPLPEPEPEKLVEPVPKPKGAKAKNAFNFYYGFFIPNDSSYRNYDLEFKEGHQFTFEYQRKFEDFFLGPSLTAKFYENQRVSGIPGIGRLDATGNNHLLSLSLISGWEPRISELVFLTTKLSLGCAFTKHELKIRSSSLTHSDSSFYYSVLAGLGFQWSETFHSLCYYQFDGHSAVGRFDDQSFHQIGISFGMNY
jgi:hypothetical protein